MSFQTPGGPAAKRRRIETANATLRKPFRSPLVNRQQTEPGTESAPSPSINRDSAVAANFTPQPPATPAPARGGHRLAAASPLSTSPSLASASTPGPPPKRPASIESNPTQDSTTTTTTPKHPSTSPTTLLTQLHNSQLTLTSTLRATQARLDLARQAQRIEQAAHAKRPGEPVDAELCAMAARWKATSRLAAEELFGLVRGRVDGMGGARAWRGTRGWRRRGWEDDDDGGCGGGGDGRGGGEGEGGGSDDGVGEDDDGDGGTDEGKEEDEEEESGESEFTMMMMLKSLNIEPEVLGYDPVEEKWLD